MPATRSSSSAPRSQRSPFSTPSRPRKLCDGQHEALNLSSSDVDGSSLPLQRSRREKSQLRLRATKAPFVPVGEVIEISSDDESSPQVNSQTHMVADFRRQINRLREESIKHKKDYERAARELKDSREENQQLQALRTPGNGKVVLDASQLTDHLDCEICTSRMWTPYVLPDCGHTYCQSCLQDWFGTTLAQFMNANPHYDIDHVNHAPQLDVLLQTLMQNPRAANHPQLNALLTRLLPLGPQYTCPTCREPVRTRPTEDFTLKALVRTIANATGENSPKKPVFAKPNGKASITTLGPWDGFFPRRRT
ncbi:hypothetical protein B0H34DRAFT_795766 [Crassisporium funariophilum]|nr:hypothetical protein B0H34DRAFT_795766 [Crassisporium funariophilum]